MSLKATFLVDWYSKSFLPPYTTIKVCPDFLFYKVIVQKSDLGQGGIPQKFVILSIVTAKQGVEL